MIAGLVEQGQGARIIRHDLKPSEVAGVVLSSLHGLTLDWTLKGQTFDLEEEGARLADNLIAMIRT